MALDHPRLSEEERALMDAGHVLLQAPHRFTSTFWCKQCAAEGVYPMQEPDPFKAPEFTEYAEHVVNDVLPKMNGSTAFVSVVPDDGVGDVKFATELGFAIMLNKPIIAVATTGVAVPDGLRRVANAVVEGDMSTQEGMDEMSKAIAANVSYLLRQDQS